MHKKVQLENLAKQAIPVVSAAIKKAVENDGLIITDSEMFKYSKLYTGKAWELDDFRKVA